jgi:phosphatidylinositol alpha-1,6-mannosyltransferase
MAILFITHKHPPAVGGMERQSYELIRHAGRMLPSRKIICASQMTLPFFLFYRISARIRAISAETDIRLIHLNDALLTLGLCRLRRATSAPVLCTVHGLDVVFPNAWYQRLVAGRLKQLDGIIAVSRATLEECIKRGVQRQRIEVVPNGVDPGLSRIPPDPTFIRDLERRIGIPLQNKRILFSAGRPVRRKGVAWFLENVMPHLGPDVVYLIAGAAPPQDRLFRLASRLFPPGIARQAELFLGTGQDRTRQFRQIHRLNLAKRAFILGRVSFPELVQLNKLCDLFVMPNIRVAGDMEGFGLTALEASACGALVMASDIEGIPDAIADGKNGILVRSGSPSGWIESIEAWLAEPDRQRQVACDFQQYTCRHYSWERMAERYVSVFRKFL